MLLFQKQFKQRRNCDVSSAHTGTTRGKEENMKKRTRKKRTACAVIRNHKDTIFRMIFKDKKNLLGLYNAINDTSYDNPDDLEITTLENAIYMSVKNDISCVVDMRLNLYEHQSTVNPNMPLRDLDYVSRTYAEFYRNEDIYSSKLIKIPNPRFIVFYNGEEHQPAIREFRLSDAFAHEEENPKLELIVTQININPGYNDELMEKCSALREYMIYVDKVRTYQKTKPLEDAVNLAVDECIKEDVLSDFFKRNRAEVVSMSLFEYDKELHEKTIKEIAHEEGFNEGREVGITQGKEIGIQQGKEIGIQQGKEIGIQQGKEIGIQQGKEIGIQQGKEIGIMYGTIVTYYKCGKTIEEISELTGQSTEHVKEILETQ